MYLMKLEVADDEYEVVSMACDRLKVWLEEFIKHEPKDTIDYGFATMQLKQLKSFLRRNGMGR